jgi:hypothetical protein
MRLYFSCDERNEALASVAQALESWKDSIQTANRNDMAAATTNKIDAPLLKRLDISSESKFQACLLLSLFLCRGEQCKKKVPSTSFRIIFERCFSVVSFCIVAGGHPDG